VRTLPAWGENDCASAAVILAADTVILVADTVILAAEIWPSTSGGRGRHTGAVDRSRTDMRRV